MITTAHAASLLKTNALDHIFTLSTNCKYFNFTVSWHYFFEYRNQLKIMIRKDKLSAIYNWQTMSFLTCAICKSQMRFTKIKCDLQIANMRYVNRKFACPNFMNSKRMVF